MCYPCKRCGKCKEMTLEVPLTCPICGTSFPSDEPGCPSCGWSLAAPGASGGALGMKAPAVSASA